MGKFLDQKFYIDFELTAGRQSNVPYSDDTPVDVRFMFTGGQQAGYFLRTVSVTNAFNDSVLTYQNMMRTLPDNVWQGRGGTFTNEVVFSYPTKSQTYFTLEFGNLNLPLTEEVINLLNDSTYPKFKKTIEVEKEDGDVAFLTALNRFGSGRKIIRRSYYSSGTLRTERNSWLLTTDSELRLPIPLILTVERPTAGVVTATFMYTPAPTLFEIHSTGEENTSWT